MATPLRTLIDVKEPDVARGFADSVRGLKDSVLLKDLIAAIERRNIDEVMAILDIEEAAFSPFRKSLRDTFEVAGQVSAARFSSGLKKARRG